MTITLYAFVMAFGALIAILGLILLFRKHEQSLSRVKIFGQEFQFSAPGVVVTLAGCALLVLLPVLGVNDKPVIAIGGEQPGPVVVSGWEKEPNDNFETANVIQLGTTTKGAITPSGDRDFFKLQIPASLQGLPSIKVSLEKKFDATVTIYDQNEQKVDDRYRGGDEAVMLTFGGTPGAYYYIVVDSPIHDLGEYKLTVKQEK